MLTLRTRNYRVHQNEEMLRAELDLLEKDRLKATIRNEVYRKRVMRDYNKNVRHRDFE